MQRPWGWNELVFKNIEKTDEAGVQGKSGGIRPERQEVHYREKKLAIRFILCKLLAMPFTIIPNLKMPHEKHIKKIVRATTPSLNQLQAPNLYSMADRFVLSGKEQDLVTCQLRVSRQLPPKLRRLKQVLAIGYRATDCCSPSTLNPSVCCTCPVVSQCPVFLRGQE